MNTALQALGWTLMHSLWQGIAIAVLALIAATGLRSSVTRYWIYCAALGLMLLMPGLTLLKELKALRATGIVDNAVAVVKFSPATAAADAASEVANAVPAVSQARATDRWAEVFAWVWLCGVGVMAVRAGIAAWFVRNLRKTAKPWLNDEWQLALRRWCDELGIRRGIRLCTTLLNDVPAVVGHFKPMILLPAALVTRLSPEQLEAVILHELMHVRRHDFLVNLLQVLCETLLFFHPAAWWVSRAIRREREHCCDDFASERTGKISYAKTLMKLEQWRGANAGLLEVAGTGGVLKNRITRLLAPRPVNFPNWIGPIVSTGIVGLALAFGAPKSVAAPEKQEKLAFQLRIVAGEGDERPTEVIQVMTNDNGTLKPGSLRVLKEVVLNDSDVAAAEVEEDLLTKTPQVSVKLNAQGALRFSAATRENIGKQAAVIAQGRVVATPIIQQQISGGQLVISGNLKMEEAREIADVLKAKAGGKKGPSDGVIEFRSYFFKLPDGIEQEAGKGGVISTVPEGIGNGVLSPGSNPKEVVGTGDESAMVRKLSGAEANNLLETLQKSSNAKPLSAPILTTTSGKSARIEVGKVAAQAGQAGVIAGKEGGAVHSVNATGYVTTKHPDSGDSARLIGQSLEILPELYEKQLVVAGRFRVDREAGENIAAVEYLGGPFYVSLKEDECFMVTQKARGDAQGGGQNLILLVVPKVR